VQAFELRKVARIVVVGIGNHRNIKKEVKNMASTPHDRNAIVVSSFRDLPTVESRLGTAICGSKYITLSPISARHVSL